MARMLRKSKSIVFSIAVILFVALGASSGVAQMELDGPGLNQPVEIGDVGRVPLESAPEQLADDENVKVQQPTWTQQTESDVAEPEEFVVHGSFVESLSREAESMLSREGTESSVKAVLLIGALSLAPALLLMTTCYIRIIVVLSLLRQAFGSQQLPPTQVLTALSLFVTLLVMAPVWQQVKEEAIDPYSQPASQSQAISWDEAWSKGVRPIKEFMTRQIEIAQNENSVAIFYKYLPEKQRQQPPSNLRDVPINVLLPAFVISELKVAFLLGFQIYLPFLVLDLVVSAVTVSMGMLMLPPTMVSFPLKLILFVMVDGWNLVVGMLLQSMGPFT